MGDDARIEARGLKLEVRVSSIHLRASTRLPTPMVTRPSLAGELARLPTAINGMQDGMAGRYELRQRQTLVLLRVIWRKTQPVDETGLPAYR